MTQRMYRIERDHRTWIGTQSKQRATTDAKTAVTQFLASVEGVRLLDEVEVGDDALFVTFEFDRPERNDAQGLVWHGKLADAGVQATSGEAEEEARKQIAEAVELTRAGGYGYAEHHQKIAEAKRQILELALQRRAGA